LFTISTQFIILPERKTRYCPAPALYHLQRTSQHYSWTEISPPYIPASAVRHVTCLKPLSWYLSMGYSTQTQVSYCSIAYEFQLRSRYNQTVSF